jgi:putative ATP-dependent endonuclease of OLD family
MTFTVPDDTQRRAKAAWTVAGRPSLGDPTARTGVRHVYLQPLRDAVKDLGGENGERIRLILARLLGGKEAVRAFESRAREALSVLRADAALEGLQVAVGTPLGKITAGAHPQRTSVELAEPNFASLARAARLHLGDADTGGELDPVAASGLG